MSSLMPAILVHLPETLQTNTLCFVELNDNVFEHLVELRGIIERIAQIHHFAPLKSLKRIIVVFPTTEGAASVKEILNHIDFHGHPINIYYGAHTSLEVHSNFLTVPVNERLCLISPPSSPPPEWEQTIEEPPNRCVLAEDLLSALEDLSKETSGESTKQEVYRPLQDDLPFVVVEDYDQIMSAGCEKERVQYS